MEEYRVNTTFNVSNLRPFVGDLDDKVESADLRTNPLQEGGDDRRALNKGSTTRVMTRRIQEEWNSIESDRVKLLSTWATDVFLNNSVV